MPLATTTFTFGDALLTGLELAVAAPVDLDRGRASIFDIFRSARPVRLGEGRCGCC